MAHFLFAEWDGGGSLPPELTVIRNLVEAGHTITVIGDPVIEPEVRAVGVDDFRPWREAPHHVSRRAEHDYVRDWEIRNPLRMLGNFMDTLMVGPAAQFAAETLAVIDDVRPDAFAASFPLLGSLIAAETRGIPSAALVPNIVALPADGMPPYGTGFLPARNVLGRARDRSLNWVVERTWNRKTSALNDVRTAHGLAPLKRLLEQYEKPTRVLALTSAAFDFPAKLPANVRYVGPQLDDPAWAQPYSVPADDGRPLVLVSMSTTFMDHVDQLQRVVTALGKLPVRGLVTTGPAVAPGVIQAPGNVTVVESAPHNQVMQVADLVVTHGGHGTVVKALVAGLPIVCMPTGRDQPDNAARIVHRGAGARVSKSASPEKVAAAIQEVLADPQFRANARTLGEQLRADACSGSARRELEELASRKR